MIPTPITSAGLDASAGQTRARRPLPTAESVRVLPAVTSPLVTVPAARHPGSGGYFGLFRPCDCGHSSAWHSGAFGEAWRAGEQVHGGCEAEDSGCGCRQFHEAAAS